MLLRATCLALVLGCSGLGMAAAEPARADPPGASSDLLNQKIDEELIAMAIEREMALIPPRPAIQPGWSIETAALQASSARVFYLVSGMNGPNAAQRIRFRIDNPNVERASITFALEIVSARGRHYRNAIGAMVGPGGTVTGPDLELLPFEPGDPIVTVQVYRLAACAEPAVAGPETEHYKDTCRPVHQPTNL